MKSVMISIQPKWCELIASGKKTVEVRKTKPKLDVPFKVYIYCTNNKDMLWILKESERESRRKIASIFTAKDVGGATKANGKVIGEFVCDKLVWVVSHPSIFAGHDLFFKQAIEDACLTQDEVEKYSGGKDVYGWHISDLVIYDKPRDLSEFHKPTLPTGLRYEDDAITRPPQSWCYVESEVQGG